MKNNAFLFTILLLSTLLLSACRFATSNLPVTGVSDAQATLTAQNLASPTPRPTPLPTPTATATPLSAEDLARSQAVTAAQAYFAALQKGDVNAAAAQLSTFSLDAFNMTANDAAGQLNIQRSAGAHWSNLQVLGSQVFDAQSTLVHVRYTLLTNQVSQPKDEFWPFRLENNTWRYNWNNLIDFKTLTTLPQTTAGVTVMPTQLRRFTDHLALILLFQNRTNNPVVFGQPNEILVTFHFGDQTIQGDQTRVILDALRSDPNVTLTLPGLFMTYPSAVDIRKWKNYQVPPWYSFNLN